MAVFFEARHLYAKMTGDVLFECSSHFGCGRLRKQRTENLFRGTESVIQDGKLLVRLKQRIDLCLGLRT